MRNIALLIMVIVLASCCERQEVKAECYDRYQLFDLSSQYLGDMILIPVKINNFNERDHNGVWIWQESKDVKETPEYIQLYHNILYSERLYNIEKSDAVLWIDLNVGTQDGNIILKIRTDDGISEWGYTNIAGYNLCGIVKWVK